MTTTKKKQIINNSYVPDDDINCVLFIELCLCFNCVVYSVKKKKLGAHMVSKVTVIDNRHRHAFAHFRNETSINK